MCSIMQREIIYSIAEEVENLKVEYFISKGESFGIGIRETESNGSVFEDFVDDIFHTQELAEEFVSNFAARQVLVESLRDILRDHFVGKLLV